MKQKPSTLAPSQIRAGRALLNWTQETLANATGVGVATIRDYENERRGDIVGTAFAIQEALENGGVEFIPANDKHGSGVCLQGQLPNVLRWPTKRGDQDELLVRIEWRNRPYAVFLSGDTLDDLSGLGHEPTQATYLAVIEKYRRSILKAAALKIDAGEATPDHRVYLSEPDVREALGFNGP